MPHPPHLFVVCALIERGGLVLAAQRPAGKSQALLWEFPGGKIEPGEAPEAALVREIAEELHAAIEVGERLPDSFYDYGKVAITLVPFRARLHDGVEPHAAEHAALRWCGARDLRALEWAPADVPIVEHYLALRGGPRGEPTPEGRGSPTSAVA
jgi:8-oxo-dGTP diphosphatase